MHNVVGECSLPVFGIRARPLGVRQPSCKATVDCSTDAYARYAYGCLLRLGSQSVDHRLHWSLVIALAGRMLWDDGTCGTRIRDTSVQHVWTLSHRGSVLGRDERNMTKQKSIPSICNHISRVSCTVLYVLYLQMNCFSHCASHALNTTSASLWIDTCNRNRTAWVREPCVSTMLFGCAHIINSPKRFYQKNRITYSWHWTWCCL